MRAQRRIVERLGSRFFRLGMLARRSPSVLHATIVRLASDSLETQTRRASERQMAASVNWTEAVACRTMRNALDDLMQSALGSDGLGSRVGGAPIPAAVRPSKCEETPLWRFVGQPEVVRL